MKQFLPSELILNNQGGIYHLGITPEQVGEIIFFVGDPDRVQLVSRHFDQVDFEHRHRELVTHTGIKDGFKVSCISTGMGPDNIEIVMQELDFLVNTDFQHLTSKENRTSILMARLGTSGSIHPDIAADTCVVNRGAFGLDNIPVFYGDQKPFQEGKILWPIAFPEGIAPYYISWGAKGFEDIFDSLPGQYVLTLPGFYSPQGRKTNIDFNPLMNPIIMDAWKYGITNLEMETSALYYLAHKMGHKAISFSTILAERHQGTFSQHPENAIQEMIATGISLTLAWAHRLRS